jgi:rubrerythrin
MSKNKRSKLKMNNKQSIIDLKESINPVSLVLAAKVKTFDQKQIDDMTKRIDGLKVKDKANITELLDSLNLEFHGTKDSMVASILKALDINEEGEIGSVNGPMSTASIGGQYAVPLVDSQSGKTIVMKRRKSYDESFFDHMKDTLNEESSKNKAEEWFNSLSINDQKKYTNMHPFYSKMDSMHVIQAKNGIKELYKYLIDKNLIKKEDKPIDESFAQWKCGNCGHASLSEVKECPSCGSNIVKKFIRESIDSNMVIDWHNSTPSTIATFKKFGLDGKVYQDADVEQPDGSEIWYAKVDGVRYEIDNDNRTFIKA